MKISRTVKPPWTGAVGPPAWCWPRTVASCSTPHSFASVGNGAELTSWPNAIVRFGVFTVTRPGPDGGEVVRVTPALFSLPIPASRATVPTGYGFVLPDQNGWSRYLHFEAAWVLVCQWL